MKLLSRHHIWVKAQQCAETRVAKIGWFLQSHPTDNIDQFKAQLAGFWMERGIDIPYSQWQVLSRRFSIPKPGGRGKVETTALWLDCATALIGKVRDACRLIVPTDLEDSEYPLLWNCLFVSDRDYMELKGDFRYESARKQKTL